MTCCGVVVSRKYGHHAMKCMHRDGVVVTNGRAVDEVDSNGGQNKSGEWRQSGVQAAMMRKTQEADEDEAWGRGEWQDRRTRLASRTSSDVSNTFESEDNEKGGGKGKSKSTTKKVAKAEAARTQRNQRNQRNQQKSGKKGKKEPSPPASPPGSPRHPRGSNLDRERRIQNLGKGGAGRRTQGNHSDMGSFEDERASPKPKKKGGGGCTIL